MERMECEINGRKITVGRERYEAPEAFYKQVLEMFTQSIELAGEKWKEIMYSNIVLAGELPGIGLVDGPGHIPVTWKLLLEPFERVMTTTHMVREGLLCPTCGQQLPVGTRFCPKDGTLIGIECKKCGNTNAPSAQFCSNCGAKLRDN